MRQGKKASTIDTNYLRMKFVEDLVIFIQALQADGHAIVLGLDANETPAEATKANETRQCSISWLLEQTGLEEVFADQHGTTPDSKRPLDGLLIVWQCPG